MAFCRSTLALICLALVTSLVLFGHKTGAQQENDLSGLWHFSFRYYPGPLYFSCTGTLAQEGVDLSASLDCGSIGSGNLSGRVDPAGSVILGGPLGGSELELSVYRPGSRAMSGQANLSFFIRMDFDAYRNPVGPGDVDCSNAVDSVDATWLLQYDAGPHGRFGRILPCSSVADLDGDGMPTSQDALIVLQYVAGLICCL